MELGQAGWRQYWHDEVLRRQVEANDDDGVFLDSLSVPTSSGLTLRPAGRPTGRVRPPPA